MKISEMDVSLIPPEQQSMRGYAAFLLWISTDGFGQYNAEQLKDKCHCFLAGWISAS